MPDLHCPFCNADPARVFFESELVSGLWDGFPVSPDHALLVTRRDAAIWLDATPEERHALTDAIGIAQSAIAGSHRPHGFNIGINVGEATGQTVMYLHMHVIPRYTGDLPDPRGGVRWVLPDKAVYWNAST